MRTRGAVGTIYALVIGVVWLGTVGTASAQGAGNRPGGDRPRGRGAEATLWWRMSGQANAVPAPAVDTEVTIRVTGVVVRAMVRQQFANPTTAWVEGVYVFPLPDDAAVDHLRMRVGDRVIEGVIQERGAAKQTYTRARDQGRKASLVEQERPNVFTASVANVPPDAAVSIELEYQQVLRFDQGRLELRVPMVVGPRYIPGAVLSASEPQRTDGSGAARTAGIGTALAADEVPDTPRITPPVRTPELDPINPVSLRIELDAGVPLAHLASPSHPVRIESPGGDRFVVTLTDGPVPADRDFVLAWEPVEGTVPAVSMAAETTVAGSFGLLMVLPPAPETFPPGRHLPRDVIFVIDTSGSMHGAAIEQAKAALALALGRLTAEDRFNVIQFNSRTEALFPEAGPASAGSVAAAVRYVAALRAGGGTEMLPTLTRALDGVEHPDRLRQVIFLTDGLVANEERVFTVIRERLGDSRLFTVAIGSAPNGHFMREAARLGRGTFTSIASTTEVGQRMAALFRKLELPALTDITLELPGAAPAELFPDRIPDLYLGEPIVVALRTDALPARAVLRGRLGLTAWEQEVWLQDAEEGVGLSVHWARVKFAALLARRRAGAPADEIRAAVVAVAMEHHLVSPFTSLVAVDVTPARPAMSRLESHAIETNLPHAGEATAVAGLGQGATAAPVHVAVGLTAVLLAAALALMTRARTGQSLPVRSMLDAARRRSAGTVRHSGSTR